MHRARVVAALAFALSSTVLATAIARSADRVALEWNAPAECPSAAWVRREIERLAGDAIDDGPTIAADAQVEQASGERGRTWRVVVRTTQGDACGERALEASSCPE